MGNDLVSLRLAATDISPVDEINLSRDLGCIGKKIGSQTDQSLSILISTTPGVSLPPLDTHFSPIQLDKKKVYLFQIGLLRC